jgi:predicted ATPase with chaperone activity
MLARRLPGILRRLDAAAVLLDELPEFPRPILEAVREPLEDQTSCGRAIAGRIMFSARFQLVGTANLSFIRLIRERTRHQQSKRRRGASGQSVFASCGRLS